jgi:hypothetical protein
MEGPIYSSTGGLCRAYPVNTISKLRRSNSSAPLGSHPVRFKYSLFFMARHCQERLLLAGEDRQKLRVWLDVFSRWGSRVCNPPCNPLRPGFEVDSSRKRDTTKTLLDFDQPVRDQEVDGSNPFAPTILIRICVADVSNIGALLVEYNLGTREAFPKGPILA